MPTPAVILLLGLLIGSVLGLLGGGGGVLGVPLLVAAGLGLAQAQSSALLVILIGSLTALILQHQAGLVDWQLGLTFGSLGVLGSLAGSRLSLGLPERGQLGALALLLLVAGAVMWRGPALPNDAKTTPRPWPVVVLLATGVGLTTGFFGVGGGFVAVPALVMALGVPVRRASATALVVIAVNTTVAMFGRFDHLAPVRTLGYLGLAAALGSVVGALAARRASSQTLKRGFALLCLAAAVYSAGRAIAG